MLLKFYELSLQRLRTQIDLYLRRLEQGNIGTFDEYKDLAGKIYGLKQAEAIIKDIFDDVQMPNKEKKQ